MDGGWSPSECVYTAESNSEMAKQVAVASCDFEQQRTGHPPKSVTAVFSNDTLVITLRGVLSPVEMDLAKGSAGAAHVQEFHRQLFKSSCHSLRQEIRKIAGVEVREATSEVATESGTVVQVFLLADSVAAGTWSGSGQVGQG
jgi:uncharacterized protein YbcI